jgi:hypothetical protein
MNKMKEATPITTYLIVVSMISEKKQIKLSQKCFSKRQFN